MARFARNLLSWVAAALVWSSVCQIAAAATVAYWRFENNLLDETANDNDATATGTVFSTNLFGASVPQTSAANTRSLSFSNTTGNNPATHFLQVPHDASLNLATGSFTIEAWVQLDAFGSDPIRQYVLQKKNTGQTDLAASYAFLAKAGDVAPIGPNRAVLALDLPDGASQHVVFSSLEIPDAAWHFISVAVDGASGDVRFTLDGQTDLQAGAVSSFTQQDNTQSLYIGAHPTGVLANPPNHGFDGHLDELRISDAFLPAGDLLAVPEPATWGLLLVGVLGMVCWVHVRRPSKVVAA